MRPRELVQFIDSGGRTSISGLEALPLLLLKDLSHLETHKIANDVRLPSDWPQA